ncbi:unnamed protein product [Caenorhabditis angaria]|uniref:Rad21/Rec8-like protein N-terminal domain-containing protein n=1 Tax=Caenorhabditis angaria TaxID=860376 RepID=A0A9P1I493_9PELO|nr:unnamed protein product [Caenorhabditis angaria]
MVISLSQITGKDAQLALIWRLATMRNSKLGTINKRNVMQHDVRSSCKAIVSMIEKSQANRELLSLYIMAQLVYGTTVLFSRQVQYLFIDANELVAAVKNHYLINMPKKEVKKRKGKNVEENDEDFQTPRKRSKKKISDDDDLDLDCSPKLLLSQARPDLITLREQLPVASNLFDVNLVDDLVPISDADFNNMYQPMSLTFTDYQKSSGTGENNNDNPIEEIRNANSFLDENLLPIQPPDVEFLQQAITTPVKNRSDDGRMMPAPGLEDILSMGFENFRKPISNDSMDLEEELEHLKQMNHQREDQPFIPPSTPEIVARPASFELSDLTPSELMKQTPLRTPAKRGRKCGDTQITHTEMREMQNDYDSLLQTSEKYRVKIKKSYELSLKELMDPKPIVNKYNTLAPEIAEMYRSILEKPAKFDPNMGTWIDDKVESDDEDGEISTAKSRPNLPMVELDMENLKFLATPIKVQQTPPETPRRNANDLQLDEIPQISPLFATPLRSIPDIDYGNQTRFSDSLNKIQSPLNSQGPSPNDIPGSEIREKIVKACEYRAPFPAALDDVLNYDDGKRIAARTFYVLLEMTKERIINVPVQEEPFGTIKFNLRTEDTEDDDIEDIVSSQENNKAFIASSENS